MTPNVIFLGLITASVLALVIFLIWLIFKTVETLGTTRKFLETADRSLQEAIVQVNENLKALKEISENLNTMTNDMRSFSGSIKDVGDGVRQVTGNIKRLGDSMHDLGAETMASAHGLRAGLKAGVDVLLKNLFSRFAG